MWLVPCLWPCRHVITPILPACRLQEYNHLSYCTGHVLIHKFKKSDMKKVYEVSGSTKSQHTENGVHCMHHSTFTCSGLHFLPGSLKPFCGFTFSAKLNGITIYTRSWSVWPFGQRWTWLCAFRTLALWVCPHIHSAFMQIIYEGSKIQYILTVAYRNYIFMRSTLLASGDLSVAPLTIILLQYILWM